MVLSGSKALMFFQSDHAIFAKTDTSLIGRAIKSVRTVSEIIRTGDIAAVGFALAAASAGKATVETILSPTQLLVTILNTNAKGYSNLLCHADIARHWDFVNHTVSTLQLHLSTAPQILNVSNWREAFGDRLIPLTGVAVSGTVGEVVLSRIALSDQLVARYFVADVTSLLPL